MTVFYLCFLFSLRLIEETESFLMHMRSKNRTKICDVLLLISVLRIGSQHTFEVCFFVLKSFFTQDRAISANALSLQSVQIYLTGDSIQQELLSVNFQSFIYILQMVLRQCFEGW